MSSIRSVANVGFLSLCFSLMHLSSASAQWAQPNPEHKILKKEVGTWNATTKMWMNAEGKADPTMEPVVSKGVEVSRMLGDFWVLGSFKGEFGGMPFEGHSVTGYDAEAKQFIGTWYDSVAPYKMKMVGSYDKESNTMTWITTGRGMDGKPVQGKMTVQYGDDTRTMTMYDILDGEPVKSMVVEYEKAEEQLVTLPAQLKPGILYVHF